MNGLKKILKTKLDFSSEIHSIDLMKESLDQQRLKLLNLLKENNGILKDVDGFYYFWPNPNKGFFAAHQLRWIADELGRLNEPYEKQISEYFENNPMPEIDLGEFTD